MVDCLPNLQNCKAACCRTISFTVTKIMTEDLKRYYELHDCKLVRLNRTQWQIIVPVRCKALTEDYKCSLHGTSDKPRICQKFDENNTQGCYIPEKCVLKK